MLLVPEQISVDEGSRLSPGVVPRIELMRLSLGSTPTTFTALLKLRAVDGVEISSLISAFDLTLADMPSFNEWHEACRRGDFDDEYLEYALQHFRESGRLKVLFKPLAYGVAIELLICGQLAYGLLRAGVLAGDKYFSAPELMLAK
jgi:hypothetical protein